jgi:hypothetical protein
MSLEDVMGGEGGSGSVPCSALKRTPIFLHILIFLQLSKYIMKNIEHHKTINFNFQSNPDLFHAQLMVVRRRAYLQQEK